MNIVQILEAHIDNGICCWPFSYYAYLFYEQKGIYTISST